MTLANSSNTDTLRELTRSTLEFYDRFDAPRVLGNAIMNFEEEAGELIEAARRGHDMDHIAEEAADVFVTAIGICWAAGLDIEQLIEQANRVVAKNDAKTHETHQFVGGKIRRRR